MLTIVIRKETVQIRMEVTPVPVIELDIKGMEQKATAMVRVLLKET